MNGTAIAANKSVVFCAFALSIAFFMPMTVNAETSVAQGEKAHENFESGSEPLSEMQMQRLAANARIYKEKVRPLQDELHQEKRRLAETLTEEDLSVPNAQVVQAKIGQLKAEIRDLQLKKQLADSTVMTATQRKTLRVHCAQQASDHHKI